MDTQWYKYEVFEQERADLPHRHAGSVHAPDGELALENARDVFVRRPNCLSLWVVPASAVFSRTAAELEQGIELPERDERAAPQTFLVFQKQGQVARETFVAHVGQVEARSPEQALARALDTFPRENVFVWWIVPARAVIRSEASDVPSMFAPAHTKRFRNHLAYPVEPIMRRLKSAEGMLDE